MNREQFYNTVPEKRVILINEMLKNSSIKEVATNIGVPESSFSKEMTNGDYVYIKRDNQYYKFLRDPNSSITKESLPSADTIQFVEENLETLRDIITVFQKQQDMLVLDERVYNKSKKFVNKSIKMNHDVYEQFVQFCEKHYPYLTIQDLVAQSLLDFIDRYEKK
ncbi:hypothetical protein [Bacillus sp. CGMCC 1.16541]|uniref:hypothetical protein n=1 Tax=Bacillus sp. CGMCC 1.16541 TaxID=2185143 RepID=UPI000D73A6E1|nr:hypothetical protein [Bacillus sp. CGMCC 1.16541]